MGNVSIVAKIFPEDSAKIEGIKEEISKRMKLADSKIEDIAFGAKILMVMVIVPDNEGGDIESKLKEIPGVSEVQIDDISLV